MTEQDSTRVGSVHIMTSISKHFVSAILVGSFTNCVRLKVAQSSLKVQLSTVSSGMLQFRSPRMISLPSSNISSRLLDIPSLKVNIALGGL